MTQNRINIMQDDTSSVTADGGIRPASVAERFIALLLDFGVIFIPGMLVVALLGRSLDLGMDAIYLLVGCINLLFIAYETLLTSGGRSSLGKYLMGVRVVKKETYGDLGLVSAFIRALGYYISAGLFMCGFVLAFFDDKHRALQDFLAGSVVLRVREKSTAESVTVSALGTLLILAFAGFFYSQVLAQGSPVQRAQVAAAQSQLQKIGLLEDLHKSLYGVYTNDLLRLSLLSGDPVQFQRDTQAVLQRKGFRLGVSGAGYKIAALAKDARSTPVYAQEGQK